MEKKKKIEIEIWQPINNQKLEERHFYFKGQYIGGLNPILCGEKIFDAVLAILKGKFEK